MRADEGPPTGAAAVRAVREVVTRIPPGTVLSYGDVAELALLATPRVPARILALGQVGPDAPWWRVVRADGTLPDHLQMSAREHYEREATPLRDTAAHWAQVDMARARWDGRHPRDGAPEGAP
ncbi:MGMT family protein [Kocuria sp.]|uniref:MGMT family protein n=1 Tax=Kocuria sp. TaxID=1871328 RepID=UPI0026DCAB28|nr:MGMT family protein [Kocuria sp.]MDO4918261.1 MGMT family protein [Kocuria sp.]